MWWIPTITGSASFFLLPVALPTLQPLPPPKLALHRFFASKEPWAAQFPPLVPHVPVAFGLLLLDPAVALPALLELTTPLARNRNAPFAHLALLIPTLAAPLSTPACLVNRELPIRPPVDPAAAPA